MNISGRIGSIKRSREAIEQMCDYVIQVKAVTQDWVADNHRKGFVPMNIQDHSDTIQKLTDRAHKTAVSKGWHDDEERMPNNIALKFIVYILRSIATWLSRGGEVTARQKLAWLALITSELDEAAERIDSAGEQEEIADFAIRLFDVKRALKCNSPITHVSGHDWPLTECRDILVRRIRRGSDNQLHWDTVLQSILKGYDVSIIEVIEEKMRVNESRPHRHGGLKA